MEREREQGPSSVAAAVPLFLQFIRLRSVSEETVPLASRPRDLPNSVYFIGARHLTTMRCRVSPPRHEFETSSRVSFESRAAATLESACFFAFLPFCQSLVWQIHWRKKPHPLRASKQHRFCTGRRETRPRSERLVCCSSSACSYRK